MYQLKIEQKSIRHSSVDQVNRFILSFLNFSLSFPRLTIFFFFILNVKSAVYARYHHRKALELTFQYF